MTENIGCLPEIHYESLAKLETTYWWHLSRTNWAETIIKNNIKTPSELDVLDYGCGTGGTLYELNRRFKFKNYLGVDISKIAIQAAQKYGNFYQQIQPNDYSFIKGRDLVMLMDILEHIEEDEKCLKSIMKELKSTGHLFVSVPAMPGLYSTWDATLGHFRRYTKQSLTSLIERSGGSIKFISYGFVYLIPAIIIRRMFLQSQYDKSNCEFPPVHDFLNQTLLLLNRLEIFGTKLISYPYGSSLFCLIEKNRL